MYLNVITTSSRINYSHIHVTAGGHTHGFLNFFGVFFVFFIVFGMPKKVAITTTPIHHQNGCNQPDQGHQYWLNIERPTRPTASDRKGGRRGRGAGSTRTVQTR